MAALKKSELQGMKRFILRKMARSMGYDMEKVAELTQEELVDWILEHQGEEGKEEKEEKKGKKEEPKKGRGVPGRKSEPEPEKEKEEEERPRGRAAARPERDGGDLEQALRELEKKIDTIGNVLDELVKASTDNINEVRADLFVLTGGFKYLAARMEVEGVVSEESMEEERTVEDEMKRIEDETQGS